MQILGGIRLDGSAPHELHESLRGTRREVAGAEGFEPPLTAPKTAVLPLDDTPMFTSECEHSHRKTRVQSHSSRELPNGRMRCRWHRAP